MASDIVNDAYLCCRGKLRRYSFISAIAPCALPCHYGSMHDELGSYYYPNPADTRSRVYVREDGGELEFRLWHAEYPAVWEKHGWISRTALEKAAAMYRGMGRESNPMTLYDVPVALALVKEERRTCPSGAGKPS